MPQKIPKKSPKIASKETSIFHELKHKLEKNEINMKMQQLFKKIGVNNNKGGGGFNIDTKLQ